MKALLEKIQQKVSEIAELKHIDENWGQLDYYSPNMPVQYPCALIDVQQVQFTNLGKDITKKPLQRQIGTVQIKITVANMRLTNSSMQAPRRQKEEVWAIWGIIEKIHQQLHGVSLLPNVSPLIRTSQNRTLRDDGLQEYEVYYSCEVQNI
ncbi:hypothetical protein [Capnocytophaga sp. oral taxon 326]|uniref:hypothetical protein n=1 Tax=Capnocytophaga sp. oral taxon 326 TaxID=712212 RepID=UPI0002A2E2AD|nr:hypothetical protein [Capnocytophaga sp. oral taxon 326]EKY22816.1 hypothetical protein HMPREF9073_00101 [Capnocytophaga sp. oral taxon 326 str. F0382]